MFTILTSISAISLCLSQRAISTKQCANVTTGLDTKNKLTTSHRTFQNKTNLTLSASKLCPICPFICASLIPRQISFSTFCPTKGTLFPHETEPPTLISSSYTLDG